MRLKSLSVYEVVISFSRLHSQACSFVYILCIAFDITQELNCLCNE